MQGGKPGSPWGRGPQPAGPPGRLSTELQGPGCPTFPVCRCEAWAGSCPRASDGKAAPCPGRRGHGAPRRMPAQRGCPGLCVRSPVLDTAHTVLCTHTQAHRHMHVHMHTCAHAFTFTSSLMHTHTCTCTCSLCACAYACPCTFMHTCSQALVHSHTPLHTIPHTGLPRQSHMHTRTFTACTRIPPTQSHPHTHVQTPAVAPGPIPPCQAQAQPTR